MFKAESLILTTKSILISPHLFSPFFCFFFCFLELHVPISIKLIHLKFVKIRDFHLSLILCLLPLSYSLKSPPPLLKPFFRFVYIYEGKLLTRMVFLFYCIFWVIMYVWVFYLIRWINRGCFCSQNFLWVYSDYS